MLAKPQDPKRLRLTMQLNRVIGKEKGKSNQFPGMSLDTCPYRNIGVQERPPSNFRISGSTAGKHETKESLRFFHLDAKPR